MQLKTTGQVKAIVSYLRELRANVGDVMMRAGIDVADPRWRRSPMALATIDKLWRAAADGTGNSTLGLHVARSWMDSARGCRFGLGKNYARSLVKLSNCLDGVAEVQANWNMTSKSVMIAVQDHSPADVARYRSEYTLATLSIGTRRLLRYLNVVQVHFEHDNDSGSQDYQRILGTTPIFRQRSRHIMLQCASMLGGTVTPPLLDARGELIRTESDSALLDLKQLLLSPSGESVHSLSHAARKLGLGARTLQRRLQAEGVTYREVSDQVRVVTAKELLRAHGMGVEDIAKRLGFSEVTTFRRAFRRWTGTTPETWR